MFSTLSTISLFCIFSAVWIRSSSDCEMCSKLKLRFISMLPEIQTFKFVRKLLIIASYTKAQKKDSKSKSYSLADVFASKKFQLANSIKVFRIENLLHSHSKCLQMHNWFLHDLWAHERFSYSMFLESSSTFVWHTILSMDQQWVSTENKLFKSFNK